MLLSHRCVLDRPGRTEPERWNTVARLEVNSLASSYDVGVQMKEQNYLNFLFISTSKGEGSKQQQTTKGNFVYLSCSIRLDWFRDGFFLQSSENNKSSERTFARVIQASITRTCHVQDHPQRNQMFPFLDRCFAADARSCLQRANHIRNSSHFALLIFRALPRCANTCLVYVNWCCWRSGEKHR